MKNSDPKFSNFLRQDSFSDMAQKVLEENPHLRDGLQRFMRDMECAMFESSINRVMAWSLQLFDPEWVELEPKDLDRAIAKVLSQIKAFVKSFYGVNAHRPTENYTRDVEIWRVRQEHPTWSSARIGRELGLSRNAVSSALIRHQRRLRERDAAIRTFFELMYAFMKDAQRCGQRPETKSLPGRLLLQ